MSPKLAALPAAKRCANVAKELRGLADACTRGEVVGVMYVAVNGEGHLTLFRDDGMSVSECIGHLFRLQHMLAEASGTDGQVRPWAPRLDE